MKKIILSAAALFVFGFASAQDAKEETTGGKGFSNGDVFISGSVGINSTKTGDFKTSDFNISPSVGFFVTDNIAVGASVGYMSSKLDDGTDDVTNNAFTVGVFGRYYATPASDFSFFGQLGFDYTSWDSEFAEVDGELIPVDGKPTQMTIALRPGVSYFISSNFALEAMIGGLEYSSYDSDVDGADKTTGFGLNVDLTDVSLGLVYKF